MTLPRVPLWLAFASPALSCHLIKKYSLPVKALLKPLLCFQSPFLGILIEYVVSVQLQIFLDNTSCLDSCQSSIRPDCRKATALVALLEINLCPQLGKYCLVDLDRSLSGF